MAENSERQTAPNPDHEQMPADETIAAGEHMDLEAMDDALDAERRAGAAAPTGVILPAPSQTQNPYLSEEMQGMELIPKTVGPPQYGSPDPASSASRLMTLEDGHPLAGLNEGTAAISEDYGRDLVEGDAQPGPDTPTQPLSEREPQTGNAVDATEGAQQYADEHGIDLSQVEAHDASGRITKADVQRYEESNNEDDAGEEDN